MNQFWSEYEKNIEKEFKHDLKRNFYFTLATFLLITSMVIIIQNHHHTCTCYFWCGFMLSQMINLIMDRDVIKKQIAHLKRMSEFFKRG